MWSKNMKTFNRLLTGSTLYTVCKVHRYSVAQYFHVLMNFKEVMHDSTPAMTNELQGLHTK